MAVELLAPAGNFEALKAAVEAGADAVYLAGSNFGARAYAGNFSPEELTKAVRFAHLRGVAVHVTVNTIVADSELDSLAEYLSFLNEVGVDAILVQDLGVAALAKRVAPKLILHASTQMTVHSLEGVQFLENMGFSRVVLAREMTLPEIEYICANSEAEIEIFMHGALCVCYSGQCLMSSMIGARSGNRGRCAQPCRLPYELIDENGTDLLEGKAGKYLLSPKDLNTLELLPKLIAAGVDSLKIEGRMKRPEYVAVVVETYRAALDGFIINNDFAVPTHYHKNLAQIFNRDFTTAYLESNQGRQMISDMRPNNRGVLIGRVIKVTQNSLTIKTDETVSIGDQLEIWVKVGGRVTVTVGDFNVSSGSCTLKTTEKLSGVKIHDRVFKIFDAALTEHARKFFATNSAIRRIAIDFEVTARLGKVIELRVTDADGNVAEIRGSVEAVIAEGKPLDRELLWRQLSRLGNSIYKIGDLVVDLEDGIMVPISELNELRRRAVMLIDKMRLEKYDNSLGCSTFLKESCKELPLSCKKVRKELEGGNGRGCFVNFAYDDHSLLNTGSKGNASSKSRDMLLNITVESLGQLKKAIEAGADAILFGGDSYYHANIAPKTYEEAIAYAHKSGCRIFVGTPRIVREADQPAIVEIIEAASGAGADAIYVHNVATLNLVNKLTSVPIHTDYSLIAFNSETIKLLSGVGVKSVTLSPELTLEQVKELVKGAYIGLECIVHGRLELMISQYCAIGSFLGDVGEHKCSGVCMRQKFYLRDRKAALFPIVTDQFCRTHILNSKTLSMLPYVDELSAAGLSAIRIDGRSLSSEELVQTVKAYRRALNGDSLTEAEALPGLDFTRGHFFRGVTS